MRPQDLASFCIVLLTGLLAQHPANRFVARGCGHSLIFRGNQHCNVLAAAPRRVGLRAPHGTRPSAADGEATRRLGRNWAELGSRSAPVEGWLALIRVEFDLGLRNAALDSGGNAPASLHQLFFQALGEFLELGSGPTRMPFLVCYP